MAALVAHMQKIQELTKIKNGELDQLLQWLRLTEEASVCEKEGRLAWTRQHRLERRYSTWESAAVTTSAAYAAAKFRLRAGGTLCSRLYVCSERRGIRLMTP